MNNVALGIDIRAGQSLSQLENILPLVRKKKIDYRIIFSRRTIQRSSSASRRRGAAIRSESASSRPYTRNAG